MGPDFEWAPIGRDGFGPQWQVLPPTSQLNARARAMLMMLLFVSVLLSVGDGCGGAS